jgi:hypothetical protein
LGTGFWELLSSFGGLRSYAAARPGTSRDTPLCLGIAEFGVVYSWVNTRTLVLIDTPVTLAPGHIRTGDLKMNVEAYFSVQITSYSSDGYQCVYAGGLRTRRLSTIGREAITGLGVREAGNDEVTQGTYLGTFHGKPGHYAIDIEVLSASQHLDSCQPRLVIAASQSDFNTWGRILDLALESCLFCEALGVMILLVLATTRFRKSSIEELRLRIFNTDPPAGPAPRVNLKPRRSFPLLLIFGILGVTAGVVVFAATVRWYDTRGFVLVDKPVSLGPGHIKTGAFTTNLRGTYGIAFDIDVPYIQDCPQYLALKTHWVVTRDGRATARRDRGGYEWEEPGAPLEGADLGSFDAEPGTYNLDVEQLSDGRCLDVGKPRLRVYLFAGDRAEYDELNAKLQIFSFLSIGAGLAFLFAYRSERLRQGPTVLPLASSLPAQKATWGVTGLRSRRFPVRRGWAMDPILNLPTIALVCALTWLTWLLPIWVVYTWGHRSSLGLPASLARKGVPAVAIAPGLTAPLIKIEPGGHVYLNYKETTWEQLASLLDQELRRLPIRVVYFEGDNDILFMDASRAIDIIQGLGAKAILITPRSKAENR